MNKEFIKEKGFKDWYKELDNSYHLMGSDDIDSWGSRYFLKEKFGCDMDFFFDFKTIYKKENLDTSTISKQQIIGVDLDLAIHKAIGNHVTYKDNPNAINLNRGIPYGCQGYYQKFAGSSLITTLSLYDFPLEWFTREQLEILICVDAGFKQFYYNSDTNELFKHYYTNVLEYPEFIDVVQQHPIEYFYDIIKKYKMYEKIKINDDGYLTTKMELEQLSEIFNMDLSLPKDKFVTEFEMQSTGKSLYYFKKEISEDKIFSSAVTNCNYVKASVKF